MEPMATESIFAQEAHLRSILETAPDAIVVLDPQEHPSVGRPGDAPRPQCVRHVAEVEETGGGGREPGGEPGRKGPS